MTRIGLTILCAISIAVSLVVVVDYRSPSDNVSATGADTSSGTAAGISVQPVDIGLDAASTADTVVPSTGSGPETEVVMGLTVLKHRNCTVQRHYIEAEDGTVKEAFSCEPNSRPAAHPYHSYSNEALASLSYADAEAAKILGSRYVESDPDKSRDLLLRASALSGGDPVPILWLATQSYSTVRVNGVPQIASMKEAYVLRSLAERLDHNRSGAERWRNDLESHGVTDTDIGILDEHVSERLSTMRQIELDVTGYSTFAGDADG